MRNVATGFGFLAGALALSLVLAAPARAEFFGCQDRAGQVLYTYSGTPGQFHGRYANNYAAQPRPRYGHSRASYSENRRYWNDRSRW